MKKKDTSWHTLRGVVIDFLEEEFGRYDKDANGILFRCTNEKIAKELGYDSSYISRFLQNPDINDNPPGEKALRNMLEKIAYYRLRKKTATRLGIKESAYENGQTTDFLSARMVPNWTLIALIIVVLGILLAFNKRANNLTAESEYAQTYYVMKNIADVEEIFFAQCYSNIPELQLEAVRFYMREMQSRDTISRSDSLELVKTIRETLINVIGNNRFNNQGHKYITTEKTSLNELIDRTVTSDSMYVCSDSTIAFVSLEDLPSNATPFDQGLVVLLPYLLSPKMDIEKMIEKVKEQVSNVQKKQALMIADILRKEEGY